MPGVDSVTALAGAAGFQQAVTDLLKEYPAMIWTDPWPESNHSTFSWRDVPSVAFTSLGGVNYHPLRADTMEWVSPARLEEVGRFAGQLIHNLDKRPPDWTRSGA